MNNNELNAFLIEQNQSLSATVVALTQSIKSLTEKINSLEQALREKDVHSQKMIAKLNGLSKIAMPKKVEKQSVNTNITPTDKQPTPTPKERGNNGAKRKIYDLEEVVQEVNPDDDKFIKDRAAFLFYRDVVRYKFIPPRIIKYIYRINSYRFNDTVISGKAPITPLLNSNFDSSIIANLLQQRFIYGLPVERIIKYYQEIGIDMPKQTAHGLITKAAQMLNRLNVTLKDAVLSEDYVHFDETYHTLLDKDAEGGSRKAYFWVALANSSRLIHFFYDNGSRAKKVFTDYLPPSYSGAVQSDGYSSYKSVEGWDYPKAKRLGCVQHCKRKFLDIENQSEAKEIIGLYNQFYHIRHYSPKDRWVVESVLIFEQLENRLKSIERDGKHNSNSILLRGVAYCLNELESIRNIITSTEYDLDNNQIERPMRYISTSRKNSMFCGSNEGARRMATIYSLAISCRLNGVNSFEYFKDILNQLAIMPHTVSEDRLRELLPDKWNKR